MLSLHQPNQNLPTGKVSICFLVGLLVIGITIFTILNSRDSTESISEEERLQVLDAKHRDGKELSEKEFKTYCDLLERIWKKHFPACYCKDGIENPTPGIDWANAPKSPEDLGSGWVDVTDPRIRENS